MAELLLLNHDATGRQVGDILHAAPDGTVWGNAEHLEPGDGSSFLVVRVVVPLDEAKAWVVPLTRSAFDDQQNLYEEVLYPSRYYVDLNSCFDYDELAYLYTVDWEVPTISVSAIKAKVI